MPFVVAVRNNVATSLANESKWVSLHTTDPGTSGSAECATAGYARIAATGWNGPTNGITSANEVTFTIGAPGGTFTHYGLWGSQTGTDFKGGFPLSATATVAPSGPIKVTPTINIVGN